MDRLITIDGGQADADVLIQSAVLRPFRNNHCDFFVPLECRRHIGHGRAGCHDYINGVVVGRTSAGFLIGWRESGRRPQFDIVGGVSTGALLATHALLGTPADDATLEEMYTRITKDDIYKDRGIISLLSGVDSLRDTAPMRAMLPNISQRRL